MLHRGFIFENVAGLVTGDGGGRGTDVPAADEQAAGRWPRTGQGTVFTPGATFTAIIDAFAAEGCVGSTASGRVW